MSIQLFRRLSARTSRAEEKVFMLEFLCCLRESKQPHQQKVKHSLKMPTRSTKLVRNCKLSNFILGPMCMRTATNWKKYFCLRLSAIYRLPPLNSSLTYLIFIFVYSCDFNGLANVWEIHSVNHGANVIRFHVQITNNALNSDDVSRLFSFATDSHSVQLPIVTSNVFWHDSFDDSAAFYHILWAQVSKHTIECEWWPWDNCYC